MVLKFCIKCNQPISTYGMYCQKCANDLKVATDQTYKNHPVSLGEVKSSKTHDSEHWTPRECLISMLREIDNGFNPETLVICLTYKKEGDTKSRFRFSQSSKDGLHSVGLLEHVKVMMITDIESND